MTPITELDPIVHRFIEDAGSTTQAMGLGRVVGQIYAYLFFSPEPKNLADLRDTLGISKGSASIGVRQLEQWDAVRKVWVKGDRRDYYEASDWFGRIVKNVIADTVGKRMAGYGALLEEAERELFCVEPEAGSPRAHILERMKRLLRFQKKALGIWNSRIVQSVLQ